MGWNQKSAFKTGIYGTILQCLRRFFKLISIPLNICPFSLIDLKHFWRLMIQKGKDGNLKNTGKNFSPGSSSEMQPPVPARWWIYCGIAFSIVWIYLALSPNNASIIWLKERKLQLWQQTKEASRQMSKVGCLSLQMK